MAIRITEEQLFTVEDGTTMRRIAGACNSADKTDLPTEGIVNGSYMLIVDEPNTVSFFDEEQGEWQ